MRKLEVEKYVKRKESKVDSRAKTVEITDKGAQLHLKAMKLLLAFEQEYFKKIDTSDKNFRKKLESII